MPLGVPRLEGIVVLYFSLEQDTKTYERKKEMVDGNTKENI
jgi:hypothetical protein